MQDMSSRPYEIHTGENVHEHAHHPWGRNLILVMWYTQEEHVPTYQLYTGGYMTYHHVQYMQGSMSLPPKSDKQKIVVFLSNFTP